MKVSKKDHISGQDKVIIHGDGTYNESDYWANFDEGCNDFELAIERGSYERYLSAIGLGVSAIEAFLNHQYMLRRRVNHTDQNLKIDLES